MLHDLTDLYSDAPIKDASHDAFGREAFATQMASVIHSMGEQSESSVAALVGSWGSGKSSVLNLLEHKIEDYQPAWNIRRFNPWLFSDIDSLLLNFFDEITSALPTDKKKDARQRVGEYAKKLAPIGKLGGFFGADLQESVDAFGKLLSGEKSAQDQRADLVKELTKLEFRVLIVMDDVDRLQPDELLTVLKLIRLIGDLPNIHYLLAYDERTLLDVLMGTPIGNNNEVRASQYIDKMVQVRFDLPQLTDYQQDALFQSAIYSAFKSAKVEITQAEFRRLTRFYREQMREPLRVPRRINKYFGQLSAFLTSEIARELNVVDFCILTYVRTFEGPLYYRLPGWKNELLGTGRDAKEAMIQGKSNDSGQLYRERWQPRLESAGFKGVDQARALDVLAHLFPTIEQFTDPHRITSSPGRDRIVKKSISTVEYFDRFFQFAVPADDISDVLVSSALDYLVASKAEGEQSAINVSQRINKDKDATIVLDKMWALVQNRECPAPRPLILLLNKLYGPLKQNPRNFGIRDPQDIAMYMAADVFAAIPEDDRAAELDFFALNLDLGFLIDVARQLHDDGAPLPWSQSFRSTLSRRARKELTADLPSLENVSQDQFDLFKAWGKLEPEGEARQFAQQLIDKQHWDIENFLRLITTTSHMVGDTHPSDYLGELDDGWIDYFIGVDYAIAKLGHRLQDSIEPVTDEDYIDPTPDVRLRYALLYMQEKAARLTNREEVDSH